MIEYKCPHCQTELEAEDDQVGKRALCPECKSSILIPASQHQQRVDQLLDPHGGDEEQARSPHQFDFEFDFDQLAARDIEQLHEQQSHAPPPSPNTSPESAESTVTPAGQSPSPLPWQVNQRQDDTSPFGTEKPGKKTREEDLSPLRIDDISPEVEIGETASVICRICDTRIVFPKSQIGTKLKCPECFTMVDAVPVDRPRDPNAYFPDATETLEVVASPDGDLKLAEPDHVKRYRDQDDELTGVSSHREFNDPDGELFGDVGEELAPLAGTFPPLVSLPQSPADPAWKETPVRENDDDELKLEVETPKVKPQHSFWIETEFGPADDPHAVDAPPNEQQPVVTTPTNTASIKPQAKSISPQSKPAPRQSGKAVPNPGQARAQALPHSAAPAAAQGASAAMPGPRPQPTPGNPYQPPPADPVDEEELERERNPLGMSMKSLNFGDNKLFQWLQQVYGDWQVSLRLLIIAVGLAVAYWLLGIAQSYAADEQSTAATRSLYSVVCGLPGLILFLLAWGALFAIGGLLLEAGGNRRPKVEDWSGQTFGNYLQHLVFMLFAFWLAALPGLFLGVALYLLTKSFLGTGLLVAFSAYILSPLMYYGGLSNGSAFWIIPRNLGDLFASTSIDWVRYVPVSLICWGIFLVGSLLLIPGGMLWCLLGSLLHIVSFTAFASLIGLYSGLLGDAMREEEERKALVEKLKQKAAENSR